jgi:hypothetical protein
MCVAIKIKELESKPVQRKTRILECMLKVRSDVDMQNEWSCKKKKLEVLVQVQRPCQERRPRCGGGRCVDSSLGVIRHTLLEEVGLALERDHIHKVEGVRHVVYLVVSESHKESVGNELDILAHELGVHADESNRKGI